jgi:hypothetical protein
MIGPYKITYWGSAMSDPAEMDNGETDRVPASTGSWLSRLKWRAGGARPAPSVAAVRPDDTVMISRYVDGKQPWLDTGKPVLLGHLVAAAVATGRSAQEIADRLTTLGYRVTATPPAEVQPGDQVLVSRMFHGWPEWLSSAEVVPAEQVLRAAAATGRTPGEVMSRLGALGYRVPDGLPDEAAGPADGVILSRYVDGRSPWLDPAKPVEFGHLVAAAAKTDRSFGEVAARLSVLGFRLPSEVPVLEVRPGDELLVSRKFHGWPEWLSSAEVVPVDHVLRAAAATGRAPGEVMSRLAALGYRVPDGLPDEAAGPADSALLSRYVDGRSPWLDPAKPVEFGHVVAAAAKTDRSFGEVAARLTALGFQLPGLPVPDVRPGDELLVSRTLRGWPDWLPVAEPVVVGHLLRAAAITGRTPGEVAGRLAALGYQLPDVPPDDAVQAGDIVLLSEYADGAWPWMDPAKPVSAKHLGLLARATGCDRAEVAARLAVLGLRCH